MPINNSEYINKYKIKYTNGGFSSTITIAEEVVQITNEGQDSETITSYFRNVLNLSQLLTSPKTGTKINPEKAREILDTNIFELLPNQTTRQDQINEFFNEFNDLIGSTPPFQDVDNDGAGESLTSLASGIDSGSRVSHENKSTAYITRLNTHANTNNQGKTLESMRNKLNTYLGDVDNVVQVIPDQRPEYENKSSGFLKIRKPNQAIILRNPNDMLEFQKGNSYLTDGFTITMWVRFVGKTGRGTLFNFGNPTSQDSPYGFRLETITHQDANTKVYHRMVRLVVYDDRVNQNNLYDSHFGGGPSNPTTGEINSRHNTLTSGTAVYEVSPWDYFKNHTQIPTNDLNEWFFICATYNPLVDEDYSLNLTGYALQNNPDYLTDKQFWLNHRNSGGTLAAQGKRADGDLLGARCKVEVISRSDLLRARGYKVDSLEVDVTEPEQEQQQSGN